MTKPVDGQTVTSYIEVEGTVSNIPSDMHVWVAVRVGTQHWPKEPEVSTREGEWRIEVFEPGPGKPFSLVLMMVDEDGSQKISEWFNRGNRTGHYPGFAKVPGSTTLDVVNNLRIE